jgi:hypothetical protein
MSKKRKVKRISSEKLRQKLKLKHLEAKKRFAEKYPHVDKFLQEKGVDLGKVRSHSAKIIGTGTLTGALLLTPPSSIKALPAPTELLARFVKKDVKIPAEFPKEKLKDVLKTVLPTNVRPLTRNEEKVLEQVIGNVVGVEARASLEGEHLNTTYGYIGAEQHLRRFPGDTLLQHGRGSVLSEGIAPGLGAWGYFASSKGELTPELEETEKWYAVVQTLYLPDWYTRLPYLREWYKYRKVLIVNTENGNAVVASIADSGPAAWTGKHFGGSPEVMRYLGGLRYKKGPVLVFFVDDPENKIPLGPVKYNEVGLPTGISYRS